jgi:hypothetical protein
MMKILTGVNGGSNKYLGKNFPKELNIPGLERM